MPQIVVRSAITGDKLVDYCQEDVEVEKLLTTMTKIAEGLEDANFPLCDVEITVVERYELCKNEQGSNEAAYLT